MAPKGNSWVTGAMQFLAVGFILVLARATIGSLVHPHDAFAGVPLRHANPFASWVGTRLILPERDESGALISREKPALVLLLDCTGCGDASAFAQSLRAAPIKPVILVGDDVLSLPASIRKSPHDLLLVESGRCNGLPDDAFDHGPVGLLIQSGVVVKVQRVSETADLFLARGGQ